MDTDNLTQKPAAPDAKNATDCGHPMQTVNLVEMGSASTQTKGWLRGVELGFTPRAG